MKGTKSSLSTASLSRQKKLSVVMMINSFPNNLPCPCCLVPKKRRNMEPSPGVPCLKPLGASKVDSAFHLSKVDKMSNRNFWELRGKN